MVSTFIVYGPRNREFYVHVGEDGGIVDASQEIEQFVKRDWIPVRKKFEEQFHWRVKSVAQVTSASIRRPPEPPAPYFPRIPIARGIESEEDLWRYPVDRCPVVKANDFSGMTFSVNPPINEEKLIASIAQIERLMKEFEDKLAQATQLQHPLGGLFKWSASGVQGISPFDFYQSPASPASAAQANKVQRRAPDLEIAHSEGDRKLDVGSRYGTLHLAPKRYDRDRSD